jgi:hypothetical protein
VAKSKTDFGPLRRGQIKDEARFFHLITGPLFNCFVITEYSDYHSIAGEVDLAKAVFANSHLKVYRGVQTPRRSEHSEVTLE